MTWRYLILLIAIASTVRSKESTKKALIIAVDEQKPEESDVIISDLTIKDERTSSEQSDESAQATEIGENTSEGKQIDYIIVRPEDLKTIKNLKNLKDVTVDSPKFLRYPESSSDDSYEASRYTPYSQEPYSDGYQSNSNAKQKSHIVKYPSKPAPPLEKYTEADRSTEDQKTYDPPYVQKNYPTYDTPSSSLYKVPLSYDLPKLLTITAIHGSSYDSPGPYLYPIANYYGSSYGSLKPSSYSGISSYPVPRQNTKPRSYTGHSTYRKPNPDYYHSPKPTSYSSPYSHSGEPSYGTRTNGDSRSPSYESDKPNSYTSPTSYKTEGPRNYPGTSPYKSGKPASYSEVSNYEYPKSSSYSGPSSYNYKPNSYSGPTSYESPKPSSYSGPSTYGSSSPSAHSGPTSYESPKPSSYSGPSTYGSSSPSAHSGPSKYENSKPNTYSGPSTYESSKPSTYSGSSGYETSKPPSYPGKSTYYSGPVTYESSKPSSYSGPSTYESSKPSSYSGPVTYESSKPSSYSGPSTYESSKPSSYSGPSTYESSKPSSYSGPSTYESSKPSSYSGPSTYESSKPSSYSGPSTYESSKPSSYSGPSTYESSKPSSYSDPAIYESSKPNSYSGPPTYEPSTYSRPSTYEGPTHNTYSEYENTGPSIHSDTSSYSRPESSHSKSKPSSSSSASYSSPGSSYPSYKPSSYSRPSRPYYDPITEKKLEKYGSSPETENYPPKTYSHNEYKPTKDLTHENGSPYRLNKSYGKKFYNSPQVTHVLYDDLPTPHKSTSNDNKYKPPSSKYSDDAPKNTYSVTSNPKSYDSYSFDTPKYKHKYSPSTYEEKPEYISHHSASPHPSYGEKIYGVPQSAKSPKPETTYNSNPYTESYDSPLHSVKSYPKKHSYDTHTSSYETLHEPSSYEEPPKSYNSYHYPSSKVTYDSPSAYSDHTRPNTESKYHSAYDPPPSEIDAEFKPGPSKYHDTTSSHKSVPSDDYHGTSPDNLHSALEYGSRYPSSYKKTHYTNSNSPGPSHFSHDNEHHYDQKSKTGSPETNYQYDLDSSEIPPSHSAKKNYSPVRPAPTHDQLEQPRYPPLPRPSKNIKDEYYDSRETHSGENGNYNPQSSHRETKSFSPNYYSDHNSKKPLYSRGKIESHYPHSGENYNYHYSDHSLEEAEPVIFTKTSTTSYTKPYKDSSTEHSYVTEKPDSSSYKVSTTNYPKTKTYSSKDFEISQPEYRRPSYKLSGRTPQYLRSYSHKYEKTPSVNASVPTSYRNYVDPLAPKRVPGVVHRSRQSYPIIKTFRRYKGYLPYKPHYPKSTSAYEYKSVPSEIKINNVTRDTHLYDLREKKIKSNGLPKKQVPYSPKAPNNDYDDSSTESNHDAIPGQPGKDYPVLKEIPYNRFSCEDRPPGFYADVKNRCQVYFQCSEEGRLQSFLCPNGTIFNQLTFVCEWWHNVDCSKSEKYFAKNNELYELATSPKSKRTVNEKYENSNLDREVNEKFPRYVEHVKDFHSRTNGNTWNAYA